MKRKGFFFVIVIALLLLSACSAGKPADEGVSVSEEMIQEAIIKTAIAQTQNPQAPPDTEAPAYTDTPSPTNTPEWTATPTMTETPEFTETPELEPTSENPWILQSWCEDHVGCQRIEVKNQTDYWVNIYLNYLETGVDGMFSIPKRGHAWITLRPGQYEYIFTYCGGTEVSEGIHPLNSDWYIIFKDKFCN